MTGLYCGLGKDGCNVNGDVTGDEELCKQQSPPTYDNNKVLISAAAGIYANKRRSTANKQAMGLQAGDSRESRATCVGLGGGTGGLTPDRSGGNAPTEKSDGDDDDEEDEDRFDIDEPPSASRFPSSAHVAQGVESCTPRGGDDGVVGVGATNRGVLNAARTTAITMSGATTNNHKGKKRPAVTTATAGSIGEHVEVPGVFKERVEAFLEEACSAFRGSVRRAVLNYVLLDRGQRHRLGTFSRGQTNAFYACQP